MAFLRVERKKSGTYMRVVQSYKDGGRPRHRTLFSMGKVEDYPPEQLENIAKKLLELSGKSLEDILGDDLKEVGRYNYGYALVIKKLWHLFDMTTWMRKVSNKRRIRFDWLCALELMIAERLNEPCSKLSNFNHQEEYIGFNDQKVELQHFYRCLDLLSEEQDSLKKHLFNKQQSLFSQTLDVVFYDVTTLYFESQKEEQENLRQKGYCKDGKAHKTHVVLGLLVDKMRNPITYQIYRGNTYEGKTMIDALDSLRKEFDIDEVVVVADSAMIDQTNREHIEGCSGMTYIIGDRIKNLPRRVSEQLLDRKNHKAINSAPDNFSYSSVDYKGHKIFCTYSEKRARKDRHARQKLIEKAEKLLDQPSVLKQSKRRGAGRFIKQTAKEVYTLDIDKIEADAKWDGFKAIATTTSLSIEEILNKYKNLYEVEHAFRALKSQLQIRPMYHWTNKRIEGHVAMCFMAYTFLNYLRNTTKLSQRQIVRSLDKMQLSKVKENATDKNLYLRSKITEEQEKIIKTLKLEVPRDTTPQSVINQYFI